MVPKTYEDYSLIDAMSVRGVWHAVAATTITAGQVSFVTVLISVKLNQAIANQLFRIEIIRFYTHT